MRRQGFRQYSLALAILFFRGNRLVAVLAIVSLLAGARVVEVQALEGWRSLPKGSIQRLAFGSCAKHWQSQPIWEAVLALKPDLFLFVGDAIYADTDGKTAWPVTEATLRGEWNRFADKPEFQRARQSIPFLATWDNHDYGSHNGGTEFSLKEASRQIFLDFWGEPEDSPRRSQAGIYMSKIFGSVGQRVQVILLDTRSFKGPFKKDTRSKEEKEQGNIVGQYAPNSDQTVTLLGPAQWAWLEHQLREPAELRLLVSSTQVIPDEKGMDEWGNYPHERRRLVELIRSTQARGVLILSGNVHFAEVSKLTTSWYPLIEFTSSGLTHVNEGYAKAVNSYRVAGPYTALNFGLVEIDWAAQPSAQILLKAIGVDGAVGFKTELALDMLQPTP